MTPKAIIVHLSASSWGDAKAIRQWHRANGWSDIGYHAVILNGYRTSKAKYNEKLDGKIEPGRAEHIAGSHCKANGMNFKSLGVCLIGIPGVRDYPSEKQISALVHYLSVKCKAYGIQTKEIYQHSDFDKGKPFCASLNISVIRQLVKDKLNDSQ